MATAIHLVILAIFIIVCSRAITLLLYSVINNPWVCSSLLAASTVFFSLENCALLNEAQRKDEEIMALRRTHKQVREMEVELCPATKASCSLSTGVTKPERPLN